MLTDSVLCCIWPFPLFLWRVVALKSEGRLVKAAIWKKWCHKRWFEVTEQNGTLPRALEPTRVLCPSYIIVKKNYPTTWLLRRIIRRNLATDSRGTSQLGVKQQKWWKNSRKNKWKEEAYNTGYSQAVTHPSTNPARQGLTSVIRREPVFSLWYGRRREKGEKIWLLIPSMVNM